MNSPESQKAYAEWYANTQARINTVVGSEYSEDWNAIKLARKEWLAISQLDLPNFAVWLEDKYGIKIANSEFGFDPKTEVVDEVKYVLFLLKYK